MKTLIVPTDFSPAARNAAAYAAEMARNIHASITLLHVCALPMTYGDVPAPPVNTADLLKEAEGKLDEWREDLHREAGEGLKIYLKAEVGTVLKEISNLCNVLKPYAVVMGSHGASAVERIIFGSNTIEVMRHLSWPLIVVPPGSKYKDIRKIGFACDFRQVVEAAPVEEIRMLVTELNAELHVLYINKQKDQEYGPEIIEESGMLQEMLGDLNPRYHFIEHDDIGEGLSAYADKHDLDMLVIVPRRHSLPERIFRKSASKQLVLHTHVPLMAVHE